MQLSPSQRIKLISEVSKRLASEGWPLIDLTLKQFKFGIKETWSGTKEDYLIQLIAYGADDRLISLAQHVGYEFGKPALMGVEPKFWIKGCFKVFISHLSAQQAFAGQLQNELRDFGLSCFVAHKDVEPTTEWQTEIETALATADSMVALLHPDFHKSKWTDQEIGYAMGRDIPIFAVKFGEDPYGFIGRFQAFNGKQKTAKGLAQMLFEAFLKHKQTQRRMADVLIGLFENSGSFASAKLLVGYLESMEVWDPSFSPRILAVADANSQVSNSFGVPDRVKALVKKWKTSASGA